MLKYEFKIFDKYHSVIDFRIDEKLDSLFPKNIYIYGNFVSLYKEC